MKSIHFAWKSLILIIIVCLMRKSQSNPDAKRLYDDLMSDYNRIVRPVINDSTPVTVKLGIKLTQIIDLF
ncbi:Acetylcholine receptor subunit alpha-like 1 [Leptotrombidium deliense]|uniref:Acetylcholine receptor subunit alpha-like 1 n=1 Tax=Leptotrombidium deliense TaxID=299467 RepID=A0A443RVR2_9ACAR|nr:Acetylcholine receptor subunit alpha-like 1 [Leptotrombidium deliense]